MLFRLLLAVALLDMKIPTTTTTTDNTNAIVLLSILQGASFFAVLKEAEN